jgi:hypothetical protein
LVSSQICKQAGGLAFLRQPDNRGTPMKNYKIILTSLMIGLIVGLALGVNIGRNKPLLSNPFAKETLTDKMLNLGNETLEQSGKALEKSGKALEKSGKALQGK